jgi:hypothetical protein
VVTRELYDCDEWSVEILWGRDVTGNEDDPEDTAVILGTKGPLSIDGAIALRQHLQEKIEGTET